MNSGLSPRSKVFTFSKLVIPVLLVFLFFFASRSMSIQMQHNQVVEKVSLPDITIGTNKDWLDSQLGVPQFVGEVDQYQLCAYVSDVCLVQAAFDDANSLRGYLITALDTPHKITIQDKTYHKSIPVQLGSASYYSYPGSPSEVFGYVTQGNGRALYAEMYNYNSIGNGYNYYLASLDFGRLNMPLDAFTMQLQMGLEEIDDEVDPSPNNSMMLLEDRHHNAPNTYGVAAGDFDMEQVLFNYMWFNSQELRNRSNQHYEHSWNMQDRQDSESPACYFSPKMHI